MKTNTFSTILLIALVLTSCTQATTAASPTEAPVPTIAAIPPMERRHSVVGEDTVLFYGPSNIDFDLLATLKAGETVYPLATYGDFVQVAATVEGNELVGFIHNKDLDSLPVGLLELTSDNVPLTLLFSPQCTQGISTPPGGLLFESDNDSGTIWRSDIISFQQPLRIRVDGIRTTGANSNSIQLFGHMPTTNEWWKDLIGMDLASNNGEYTIWFRDGTRDNISYALNDLGLSASGTIQIVFDQVEGKSFQVLDGNGIEIRHIDLTQQPGLKLPNGLFPNREVYIGTSISPHSSLNVNGLQIGFPANGQWMEKDTSMYPGLAELAAKHNLTIGAAFTTFQNGDIRHCQVMHRDFNVAVLSFAWVSISTRPGQYDFSGNDREVNYALQQGWRIRAFHLLWGDAGAIPDWLKNGHFTRDEYIGFLKEYVRTVVGRYKGRVQEWSIANEATSRSCKNCGDFWNDKIGPEYIEIAFREAREADPDAILIFNDANNESPRDNETQWVTTKMYNTVKDLKQKGVPIDAVGMEMHLLSKYSSPIAPKKDDVLAVMRKFADLGVKVYITEFDVDLHNHPGTPEQRLQFQADLYKAMLEACLESNACGSFSTWGVADVNSWITQICSDNWCTNHPDGAPLMFDNDYNPKPAYFAVRDVLLNFSNTNPP